MKKGWFVEFISAVFILLFVYASLTKLQDFEKFRVQLGKSPIITSFAGLVAWSIPSIEILVALTLAIKRLQLIGLYASFSLMVMFSAYIVAILKFSDYIPCSCGGILQNMTWMQHLLFNLLFVILGAFAILIYPNKNQEFISKKGEAENLIE